MNNTTQNTTAQKAVNVETRPPATEAQKKAFWKNWFSIIVNAVLAGISVYLFEVWFDKVIELDTWHLVGNFTLVGLLVVAFVIGMTAYTKGTMNKIKMVLTLAGLTIAIIGLMLAVTTTVSDVVYPLSGIIIASIAFYMFALSSGTARPVGIMFMAIVLFGSIALAKKLMPELSWDTIAELSQASVFFILFVGGTWAQLRMAMHGVRGVNKDGGGYGDSNDGSGESDSEED